MLKRTALFEEHQKLNGKMVDFGGWELPVQYSGVLAEHTAVRTKAGLFDVSHMGEILVEGPDAKEFVNYLVTNDLSDIPIDQAIYSAMCNEQGGIVDDLVIYRLDPKSADEQKLFVVVNASNTDKDFEHMKKIEALFLQKNPSKKFKLENQSAKFSQIALQGPKSEAILQKLTHTPLNEIKTYQCKPGQILEIDTLIARTGYTGEDGFELYVLWKDAPAVWNALLEAGHDQGLIACGLGARDTLRLEMKYALYGNELSDETTPLETGLAWVTKLSKPDFFGKAALLKQKEEGVKRATVGLESLGRGIPRHGYEIFAADKQTKVGLLTSGTSSPSLKKPIGIALLDKPHDTIGSRVWVKIREDLHEFQVVKTPFFKHS